MNLPLAEPRIGDQTPRVANWPAYSRSAAAEVIDLARLAGLALDPWQEHVLTHGLGEQRNGRWAALKVGLWCPRQNGKGGVIEALELAWLFLLREPLIMHSAHEYKTSSEAFRRISFLIKNCADLDRYVQRIWTGAGEQGIELTRKAGGGRLRFVARSRTSGRGFSGDKSVLDEAQELTVEQMAAMMPTMSARKNPQMWFFGTPPQDGAAWCYTLRDDGEAAAKRVAWFDWGLDLDPDAPDFAERAADPELWYAANPALGIRIAEDFVDAELLPSGLGAKFASERLGIWPARALPEVAWQILPAATWAALNVGVVPTMTAPALSVEIALDRSTATIGAAWTVAGRQHVEVVEDRPGSGWVVARCAELAARYGGGPVVIDAGTESAGLENALTAANLTVLKVATPGRVAACGAFFDAAMAGSLSHNGDPAIATALAGARWKDVGDGARVFTRRGSAADISALYAVVLALHGLANPIARESNFFLI